MTIEQTFEKSDLAPTASWSYRKFSKVSSLLDLLFKITIELAFERSYPAPTQSRSVSSPSPKGLGVCLYGLGFRRLDHKNKSQRYAQSRLEYLSAANDHRGDFGEVLAHAYSHTHTYTHTHTLRQQCFWETFEKFARTHSHTHTFHTHTLRRQCFDHKKEFQKYFFVTARVVVSHHSSVLQPPLA